MTEGRKLWTPREDQAILNLVKKYGVKKWADISHQMNIKYKLYARTGKQCRQRWHNHLNPQVKKQPWTLQQSTIIFEEHRKYGNHWTNISKLLQGRTDNSIKNFFYSTLRKSLRKINKMLGLDNSKSIISNIKTTELSEVFRLATLQQKQINAQNQQIVDNCKNLQQILVEISLQNTKKQFSLEEKVKLENVINKIVSKSTKNNQFPKSQQKNILRRPTRNSINIQKQQEKFTIVQEKQTNQKLNINSKQHSFQKIESSYKDPQLLDQNSIIIFPEPLLLHRKSSKFSSKISSKDKNKEAQSYPFRILDFSDFGLNSPTFSECLRRTPNGPTPKPGLNLTNHLSQVFNNNQLNNSLQEMKTKIQINSIQKRQSNF